MLSVFCVPVIPLKAMYMFVLITFNHYAVRPVHLEQEGKSCQAMQCKIARGSKIFSQKEDYDLQGEGTIQYSIFKIKTNTMNA